MLGQKRLPVLQGTDPGPTGPGKGGLPLSLADPVL